MKISQRVSELLRGHGIMKDGLMDARTSRWKDKMISIGSSPTPSTNFVLYPLRCPFFQKFSWLVSLLLFLFVLYVILALWPPSLQCQLPALLFVCVLFVLFLLFVVVLSGHLKQNQGRRLVHRKLVQE